MIIVLNLLKIDVLFPKNSFAFVYLLEELAQFTELSEIGDILVHFILLYSVFYLFSHLLIFNLLAHWSILVDLFIHILILYNIYNILDHLLFQLSVWLNGEDFFIHWFFRMRFLFNQNIRRGFLWILFHLFDFWKRVRGRSLLDYFCFFGFIIYFRRLMYILVDEGSSRITF